MKIVYVAGGITNQWRIQNMYNKTEPLYNQPACRQIHFCFINMLLTTKQELILTLSTQNL